MADDPEETAGLYPMRVVTRLTGLAADTIRAWQRRYGAIAPGRTAGQARRFSAADVRRLTRLRDATRQGHAIGAIARLPDAELDRLVAGRSVDGAGVAAPAGRDERYVAVRREYLAALARFDLRATREQLALAAALFHAYDFVFEVALPLLREIGARWERGELTVAHEHAATAQLKAVILTLLRLPAPHPGAPRLLATTPPGHRHEFGALVAAFLAALRGWEAGFLGPEIPEPDLCAALEQSGATVLFLSVVRTTRADEHRDLARLVRRAAAIGEVWIGVAQGNPARRVVALPGVRLFDDLGEFDAALTARRT
jgi:DNA-binding transcriptional MerR regulator